MIRALLLLALLMASPHLWAGSSVGSRSNWYASKIELEAAWKIQPTSASVPVAVIDTEFDVQNAAIASVLDLKSGRDLANAAFSVVDPTAVHHGTMVAGLIAGAGIDGVRNRSAQRRAWVIPFNLDITDMSLESFLDAFNGAIDAHAKIVNLSMGFLVLAPDAVDKLRAAFARAQAADVLVIASAGNFGESLDARPLYPASFSREFSNVIAVGASDENDERAGLSNYSKNVVDVFAPGMNIPIVTPNGFTLSNGTSEAAPIVTAIAALMEQTNPTLHARDVKKILLATVDRFPSLAPYAKSGGRVNALKAVRAARQRLHSPSRAARSDR